MDLANKIMYNNFFSHFIPHFFFIFVAFFQWLVFLVSELKK